jgi:cell wall-associated NlpC family hydrolase
MNAGYGAGYRVALSVSLAALLLGLTGLHTATASAQAGGVSPTSATSSEVAPGVEPQRAALIEGKAIAPLDAPATVKKVIQAANRIRATPYIWGGGHAAWSSRGYDCSGSVSFALHGAELLSTPMVSGSFESWGAPGPGKWITIYANGTHVYAVIAGLRWDTVGDSSGTGPRWHESPPYPAGFVVRHPIGY